MGSVWQQIWQHTWVQLLRPGLVGRLWRAFKTVLGVAIIAFFVWVLEGAIYWGIPTALTENSIDRRLSALSNLFAGAALVLAVAGVLIAILAYSLSIQRPRLKLDVRLGDGTHDLNVSTVEAGPFRAVADNAENKLNITLVGKNDVSAKNPAVRVTIRNGLSFFQGRLLAEAGWSLLESGGGGTRSAQWDGGANFLVHGRWSRQLPPFPLGEARLADNQVQSATVEIEWVADGIGQQSRSVTVNFH